MVQVLFYSFHPCVGYKSILFNKLPLDFFHQILFLKQLWAIKPGEISAVEFALSSNMV